MAKNQRQLLKNTIAQVRKYHEDERSPYSLEHFLLQLHQASQSDNKDLWAELRKALANSSQVSRKASKAFFTRTYFAEEGFWWWDPAEWVLPEENNS